MSFSGWHRYGDYWKKDWNSIRASVAIWDGGARWTKGDCVEPFGTGEKERRAKADAVWVGDMNETD